jgi:hypothetical protein
MPRTAQYNSDSGKLAGVPSGGDTGIPQADGGVDSNAVIAWDPGVELPYSVSVFHKDGTGAGLYEEDSGYNQPYEDQHAPMGNECLHDWSKGHGAAPPTISPDSYPVDYVGAYDIRDEASKVDPPDSDRILMQVSRGRTYLPTAAVSSGTLAHDGATNPGPASTPRPIHAHLAKDNKGV